MKVITRFAPSPTGMLHIGGARTALFNYLFAKHTGGEFRLRIEDTDAKRSTPEATQAILDGLSWLGLSVDGDIVYQSQRAARHREVAEELVKRGKAYYCYTSAEELKEQRGAAEAKGETFKYDRKWRPAEDLPPPFTGEGRGGGSNRDRTNVPPPNLPPQAGGGTLVPPANVKPSIRIMAPLTGEIVVNDAVQGDVHFSAADALDDMIILRSDGTPTYMLAVVVDDHDMEVTHIIRGDDHLNNAGRQMMIYQAMGWNVPQFAHIPLIHGPDGAKLSKRHGATSTTEYAAMGYLPVAMRNYLARLGWGHGDDEIFSDAQAAEWFTLEHIGKAPARLDFAKLNHVNAHYIRETANADLAAMIAPQLGASAEQQALLIRAMDSLKMRASTLIELADAAKFYLVAPTTYDAKATETLAKGREHFALIIPALTALSDWSETSIKDTLKQLAEQSGKKMGELMPPMRAAIVGAMSGPDIPVAMAVLGKTESLARLTRAAAA